MGIQGVTRGCRGLQGVTRGYRGLQGVTRGDREWQGVTGELQRIIETFFCLERSQILFLGLFCIKIKVEEILNFWPKPWTNPFGKNSNFVGFWNRCFCCSERLVCYINLILGGYKGLQGVTRGYRGLQGLQGVTGDDKGLQGVKGGLQSSIETFF